MLVKILKNQDGGDDVKTKNVINDVNKSLKATTITLFYFYAS